MNKLKLDKVIKDGNIVIPLYILKYFKKLNLTMEEFVFLMYLYNKQDNLDFNPEKIASDLCLDIMEVMGYVSVLTDKGYLNLEIIKNPDGLFEEVINLSSFYDRISTFLINTDIETKKEDTNLLKYVEEELGRLLNSNEISIINGWIENNINESLIKEAFKIALRDGVYSLKYIDKILFDFKSRGYQDVSDIKKNLEVNDEKGIDVEVLDWNWLDDEEEYIVN